MDYNANKTNFSIVRGGFSLGTMGFITWLVFLILKVTTVWEISWFWVFFPLWLPWAMFGAIWFIFLIIVFIVAIIRGVSQE